jgi:anti-sigma regulatory factor (Ser/Thr protein kinase)
VAGPARGYDRSPPPTPASAGPEPPTSSGALLDLRFQGKDLSGVRSAVADLVTDATDRSTAETVVLIAQELASNAVRHGGGGGRLRVWLAGGTLCCQVSDAGPGMPNPGQAGRTLPGPWLSGGRGLWIVRRLSELCIVASPAGTTITSTLTLADAA